MLTDNRVNQRVAGVRDRGTVVEQVGNREQGTGSSYQIGVSIAKGQAGGTIYITSVHLDQSSKPKTLNIWRERISVQYSNTFFFQEGLNTEHYTSDLMPTIEACILARKYCVENYTCVTVQYGHKSYH